MSAHADGEQHVTLDYGLHGVWHGGVQGKGLAGPKQMPGGARVDMELPTETMNHDVAGRTMLRQTAAGLKAEEQEPEAATVDQANLPMPVLRRVGLALQRARKLRQVERHDRPAQAIARMRSQPLV